MRICDSLMPCESWFDVDDLCLRCGTVVGDDRPIYERYINAAVSYVFNRTGRQFTGCCEYIILPCRKKCCSMPSRCSPYNGSLPFAPMVGADGVYNRCCVTSCCDKDDCSCTFGDKIEIIHNNFVDVVEVMIDGIVLDPNSYKIQYSGGRVFVRRVDGLKWPDCQDLNVGVGEVGSWHIKYRAGVRPRADLVEATMLFAVEMANQCLGKKCSLPKRYTTIGDSPVLDLHSFVKDGLTGFTPLDIILFQINPLNLKSPIRFRRTPRK